MAQVTLEITVGKGEKQATHKYTFDGDDVPLLLLEASQEGKAAMMREAIQDFLEMPPEIAKQLTMRHVKQIGAAIKEAIDSPNA